MGFSIAPVPGKVVLQRLDGADKTKGGIVLPTGTRIIAHSEARVVAIGEPRPLTWEVSPDHRRVGTVPGNSDGVRGYGVGDVVVYMPGGSTEIERGLGKEKQSFVIVDDTQILGKLTEDSKEAKEDATERVLHAGIDGKGAPQFASPASPSAIGC